jgi:hypothetical protein
MHPEQRFQIEYGIPQLRCHSNTDASYLTCDADESMVLELTLTYKTQNYAQSSSGIADRSPKSSLSLSRVSASRCPNDRISVA